MFGFNEHIESTLNWEQTVSNWEREKEVGLMIHIRALHPSEAEEQWAWDPTGYPTQPCEARIGGEEVTGKDNRHFSCALCGLWGQVNNSDLKKNLRKKKETKEPLQLVAIKPM